MLKFLATIGGSKPKDPLTDLSSVSRWMEQLPMADTVLALGQLGEQVREFATRKQPLSKEMLSVLTALDEHAQVPLAALRQQYLQNPRMSRAMESRLWNSVHGYYQDILPVYHRLIMDYIANPGGSKIASAVPLLTARVIRYFSLDARWSYYRYTDVNPKLWKRLHNLYHFAEYEEFERREFALYPGEAATHIASIYLDTLMLETLNTGSLTPRQMHLVEQWLPMLTREIRIDRTLDPANHAFYVNLAENRGARRVRRVEPGEHHRFWSTLGLKGLLDDLRRRVSAGEVPARLGLTEECRLPACLELLDRIAAQWSPGGLKRLQRTHARKPVIKSIEVLRGLNDICTNVRADNLQSLRGPTQAAARDVSYAEMVDVHLYGFVTHRTQQKITTGPSGKIVRVAAHERWVMENESDGGYGANINDREDDWVRLGKLVGLKPERKAHWNIGVIRRLRRANPAQQYVGIEVIAERPITLVLRPTKKEERPLTVDGIDPVGAVFPISALYLKGERGMVDCLILQSAEFSKHRELWFNFSGHSYQIKLGEVLERGDDWLRVGFTVLAKEPLSAEFAPSRS